MTQFMGTLFTSRIYNLAGKYHGYILILQMKKQVEGFLL